MARKKSEDVSAVVSAKKSAKKSAVAPATVTAVIGDSLLKIALKTGVDVNILKELNPGIKFALMPLKLGQVVRIN